MTTSEFIKQNLNGISLYRLSQLTGIKRMTISNIVNGVHEPSFPKFKAIVQALNISDESILEFIKK